MIENMEDDIMKLIGLCGKMGSGKTTLAQIMIDHGIAYRKISFANGVRFAAKYLFDIDSRKRNKRTREILQQIGQKMRDIDPDVWIKTMIKGLNYIPDIENEIIVIDDVRYKNEVEWILKNNGIIIIIGCDDETRRKRIEKRDNIFIPSEKWHEISFHKSELEINFIYTEFIDHKNVYFYANRNTDDIEGQFLDWIDIVWKDENEF